MIDYIAHIKESSNGWIFQSLEDHLKGTASLAENFAKEFGSDDWAKIAGLYHDLGKFLPEWQQYIRLVSGYEGKENESKTNYRINHSSLGAILNYDQLKQIQPIARILSYVIAGHHAGLSDWYPDKAGGDLQNRIFENNSEQLSQAELKELKKIEAAKPFLSISPAKSPPPGYVSKKQIDTEHYHLWIRMLFSCLVDADYLDTELFMSPKISQNRGNYPKLSELNERLNHYLEEKNRKSHDTLVNRNRQQVLNMCRNKAKLRPGFFSLTVPTGGGKTLSSMAFALEHSLEYDKKRVIMAIPYTSIIEQSAKVYKFGTDDDEMIMEIKKTGKVLFGEESVVEHHSNLDPDMETPENRLATENWDAPIVVTTNVQLFESLFSCRSSSCRKLHNLVNSVIILDEAQMLPPEYLKPILSGLKGLVQQYSVSVVLCTATQPSLKGSIGSGNNIIQGLENCREIIDDPAALNQSFNRVNISFPENMQKPDNWENIAKQVIEYEKVLCIVNTRKDCRELHSLMPEGTIQLSALMCGEERSHIISNIKKKLATKEPLRVISTQLVEAGVDIDFPVIFRAMAGLDSIAQAAGRCNREGKIIEKGEVIVFNPPKPAPPGLLRKGEDATKTLMSQRNINELTPELFDEYFKKFFGSVNDFDKPRFRERLVSEADEFKFQFRTFSEDFNLIDNATQKGIIIWFEGESGNSLDLIEELRRDGPSRRLLRKMQRFTVNVPVRVFEKLRVMGYLEDVNGYFVQAADGLYKPGKGLIYQEEDWIQQVYAI
jgi:CRISPR-associated endonuclease/helicase Cas3